MACLDGSSRADQLHHRPQPVSLHDGDLADRVHRDTAPMRPTDVRRQTERPRTLGGVKIPSVAEAVDRRMAGGAIRSLVPHTLSFEKRWGLSGGVTVVNAGWATLLAGNVTRGDGRSSPGKSADRSRG